MMAACALTVITYAFAIRRRVLSAAMPGPARVLFGLGLLSLFQSLPLPPALSSVFSPVGTEIWRSARELLGLPSAVNTSLSLDPGASMREAIKWSMYALAFSVAAALGRRRRAFAGPLLVWGSATLVGLVTLAHQLSGATSAYGLYEPHGEFARSSIGPLLNPNNLAGYENLGLFAGLSLLVGREGTVPRWVVGLGCLVCLLVGVATVSRGGLLSLGAGGAVLSLLLARRRELRERLGARRKSVWIGAGVAVALGALLGLVALVPNPFQHSNDAGVQKLTVAWSTLPLMAEHFWFGVGRGAFESAFQRVLIGRDNLIFSHPENFVVQWAVEWGVPAAVLALGTLSWFLRPAALGVGRSISGLIVGVGLGVLLLQNLVDLGLEVPGVALGAVVCVGSVWGSSIQDSGTLGRQRLWAWGAAGAVSLLLIGGLFSNLETVGDARRRVEFEYRALDIHDPEAVKKFRAALQSAVLSHPADPYFPRIGASLAFQVGDAPPMPWIGHALGLGMMSGRSHLLLARMLTRWHRNEQAVLEMRLALTYEPARMDLIAKSALQLTHDPDLLSRAAPEGQLGAKLLTAMAHGFSDPADKPLRMELLRRAIRHSDDVPAPRVELAAALLRDLESKDAEGPCQGAAQRAACIEEVKVQAARVSKLSPQTEGPELLARLLLVVGDPAGADQALGGRCEASARRSCLMLKLRAAVALRDTGRVIAVARILTEHSCLSAASCAQAYDEIAGALDGIGEAQLALTYFERAAREDNAEKRWLRLADAASRSGHHAQALDALTRVARKRRGDAKLMNRMEDERRKLLLESMPARSK